VTKYIFLLPQDFFSCNKNILPRKKYVPRKKKSWGKKKTVLSLSQEEFRISWRQKTFL